MVEAIVKKATASGSCLICGGGGWVGIHGDGCPLEALEREMTTTTTRKCHACRKIFTIMVVSGKLARPDECRLCFKVSSRGVPYMERALEVAANRLKWARAGDDPKALRKAKRQAAAIVRLLKRASG